MFTICCALLSDFLSVHTLSHTIFAIFAWFSLDLSLTLFHLRFGFCSSNNNHHERTDRSLRSLASRLARRNLRSPLIGHRTVGWDRFPSRRHCSQWWRRTIGCSPASIRFDTGCRMCQCCNRNHWCHTQFRPRSPSRPSSCFRTNSGRTRWRRSHFGMHWSHRSRRYWPRRVSRTGPCWPADGCVPDSFRGQPSRAVRCTMKRVPERNGVTACSSEARTDLGVRSHNGLVSLPVDRYRAFHRA